MNKIKKMVIYNMDADAAEYQSLYIKYIYIFRYMYLTQIKMLNEKFLPSTELKYKIKKKKRTAVAHKKRIKNFIVERELYLKNLHKINAIHCVLILYILLYTDRLYTIQKTHA